MFECDTAGCFDGAEREVTLIDDTVANVCGECVEYYRREGLLIVAGARL